jgi:hypothetical protein
MIIFWLTIILFIYVTVIFVGIRLVVPFLGFGTYPMPLELPAEIKAAIKELETNASDPQAYAARAYEFVQARWYSKRLRTVTAAPLAFRTDLAEIWNSPGYAHCHTINRIYIALLVGSKFFSPEDIEVRHKFFNFMIHQYVRVRMNGAWLDTDPSLVFLGHGIGKKAGFFG